MEVSSVANSEHLKILTQGVDVWNQWREEHPEFQPDLGSANLSRTTLKRADLQEVYLRDANLRGAQLSGANLRGAQLFGVEFQEANLSEVDMREANLSWANLSRANLRWANLSKATLSRAILNGADLCESYLVGANLNEANLSEAYLNGVNLSQANLYRADLIGTDLRGATLNEAKLIYTKLGGANITDVCLWESQRAGWSIRGILCEAVYWDEYRLQRIIYAPGEFERLHADKSTIVLNYPGGITRIEIATLPLLIKELESRYTGCVLRFQSIEEAPGGARATLIVDDPGDCSPTEIERVKAELQTVAQDYQKALRAEQQTREQLAQLDQELQIVYDKIIPRLAGHAMEQPKQINISVGTMHGGNLVGEVSGEQAQVNYTHNDLASIERLVGEILDHHEKLAIPNDHIANLTTSLRTVQTQLTAQTPNRSIIKTALQSVHTILAGAAGNVLANAVVSGQLNVWLQQLQRLLQ